MTSNPYKKLKMLCEEPHEKMHVASLSEFLGKHQGHDRDDRFFK